ncbi:GAP family protein [Streptomyces sp. NPDC003233]
MQRARRAAPGNDGHARRHPSAPHSTEAASGHAVGDVLGLAAGVAVSPLPIVAIILILATPRGHLNGSLFALGWVLGLAVLGAIMLAVGGSGSASTHKHPATWVGALKLAPGQFRSTGSPR